MLSRFRWQVRGLAGRIRQLSRGLSVCRQPSARAEIHSPPGPTGCSLDRAPLPAFPVPGLSGLGYHTSRPVCGERTLTTAQKLSERTNRARIISICPLHNIVGV